MKALPICTLIAVLFMPAVSAHEQTVVPVTAVSLTSTQPGPQPYDGFLYGRITTGDGAIYQGRLRWGGDEEAFWSNYFNGVKDSNLWAAHVSPELLVEQSPIDILGLRFGQWANKIDLDRPLMVRFGDINRIDAHGLDLKVTMRSGTVFDLDRLSADDYADGLTVWDETRGVLQFDEWKIRRVEFLPTATIEITSSRLHATVLTEHDAFTGFIQWDREACLGSDQLSGLSDDGEVTLPFDSIRSISRQSDDSARVTLHDGREIALFGTRQVGNGNRGVYVDDRRYGRVLVSWSAFRKIKFSVPGDDYHGSGPAYDDFPRGQALAGTVTTRDGYDFTGRLVYDLDESETTETLDAPLRGVDYSIPFGLIASILRHSGEDPKPRYAQVVLHSGEELQLELGGDLGERNAGLLVFVSDAGQPIYRQWSDVLKVDFNRSVAAGKRSVF